MNVEIRHTADKGRCVFATDNISKGDTFVAEGIIIDDTLVAKESIIWMYTFSTHIRHKVLLILDWPSFMSNSSSPNVTYEYIPDTMSMRFRALRDIEPDEELTINYGYDVYEHASHLGIDISDWNMQTNGGLLGSGNGGSTITGVI